MTALTRVQCDVKKKLLLVCRFFLLSFSDLLSIEIERKIIPFWALDDCAWPTKANFLEQVGKGPLLL